MPKKAFFQNIGTILTYAVVGTLFNAFAIGLTIYGCYLLGLFPDIDEGASKPLGILGNGLRKHFVEKSLSVEFIFRGKIS